MSNHPPYFDTKLVTKKATLLVFRVFVHKKFYPKEIKKTVVELGQEEDKSLSKLGKVVKKCLLDLKEKSALDFEERSVKSLKRDMLLICEGALTELIKNRTLLRVIKYSESTVIKQSATKPKIRRV